MQKGDTTLTQIFYLSESTLQSTIKVDNEGATHAATPSAFRLLVIRTHIT